MGQLSRSTGRLLRRVGGKPHANDEDHEESETSSAKSASTARETGSRTSSKISSRISSATSLATSSRTSMASMEEDDIYADPLSSDEEASAAKNVPERPQFVLRQNIAVPTQPRSTPQWRSARTSSPPQSAGSKRSADAASEHPSSDSDDQIFSSQASQAKRPRITSSYSSNIHAMPKPTLQRPRTVGYGQQAARQRSREEEKRKQSEARRVEREEKEKKIDGPKFKSLRLGARAEGAKKAVFLKPGTGVDCVEGTILDQDALSDLSDLSDPPSTPPEMQDLVTGPRMTECAVCEAMMPAAVREDFEDQYSQARQWSYRWQQRFCKFHKEREALEQWRIRGYPEIDWDEMAKRIQNRRYKEHLKRIIGGALVSTFRSQFEERVKAGAKSAAQAADSDISSKGVQAGYYGPRGERLMTEHITDVVGKELRKFASTDRLVATRGVGGGVSGFVQAVLVPELTVQLIREDMACKCDSEALAILAESTEVGDVLNPELDERIQAGADDAAQDDDLVEER